MRHLLYTAAIAFSLLSVNAQAAGSCGKVTIADMNWSSATLIAHIDRFILQHGYGCDAELVPGDTMPTGTSMMEKGEPDIAPELWSNSFKEAIDKGLAEKRIRVAGMSLSDGGEEGFWVPDYMVAKDPSLATIKGIIANAKMFKHPEDPDKSGFMDCPSGWGCQVTNGNLFNALKLQDAGFDKVDPGSGAALAASIAKAYERKAPWFGYYWSPTAVLGKYKMVKVDFGQGVMKDHFVGCLTQKECANPKPSMFPPSPVHTIAVESFAARAPEAYGYLTRRAFKNAEMNVLLAWMKDNQADGDVAMEHFLKTQAPTWMGWVSGDVATKVKKALSAL